MVKIGYVRRAHGVRGAVVVQPLSDHPGRFGAGARLETDNASCPSLVVEAVQQHKEGLLISFVDVQDRDHAEALRGTSLLIPAAQRRALGDDEFWPDQLEGLTVRRIDGHRYGTVTGVIVGAAQDRLAVDGPSGVFEVPFVAALVLEVDLERQEIVVDLPEGLAR